MSDQHPPGVADIAAFHKKLESWGFTHPDTNRWVLERDTHTVVVSTGYTMGEWTIRVRSFVRTQATYEARWRWNPTRSRFPIQAKRTVRCLRATPSPGQ